MSAEVR